MISQSEAQAAQLWRLREGITESLARTSRTRTTCSVPHLGGAGVPGSETQNCWAGEYPQFDVVWFGHIGDGNLHINVAQSPMARTARGFLDRVRERVTELLWRRAGRRHDGSISAEHGIGLVKKPYLWAARAAPKKSP